MVRVPNQGAARGYSPVKSETTQRCAADTRGARGCAILGLRLRGAVGSEAPYLAPAALAYLRRNLSTRPAVSTIFCLPM